MIHIDYSQTFLAKSMTDEHSELIYPHNLLVHKTPILFKENALISSAWLMLYFSKIIADGGLL